MKRVFTLTMLLFLFAAAQAQVPNFSFKGLNGQAFTQANLKKGFSTIVIFFDPWCDHCEQQAKWIAAAPDKFRNTNILFVTTEPQKEASVNFRDKFFGKSGMTNVHFMIDTEFRFDAYFKGYYEVPSILIYNKEGKHVKTLNKETPAEQLAALL